MKKLLTNIKLFHRIAIIAVIAVMVTATAASYAFWKSGVSGDSRDKELSISIGEGLVSTGKLVTTAYTHTSGRLIPVQRVHEYATLGNGTDPTQFVSFIQYSFKVAWLTDISVGTNEYSGQLDLEYLSAKIGDTDIKNIDAKEDGLKLFTITKTFGTQQILAQHIDTIPQQLDDTIEGITSIQITIKIELNEPKDSATYNLIANSNVKFNFRLSVLSDREN